MGLIVTCNEIDHGHVALLAVAMTKPDAPRVVRYRTGAMSRNCKNMA
jgi:hypothetical protein